MPKDQVKIKIENVSKIFGENWQTALEKAKQGGINREELLNQTGCTIGIININLNINVGETFVIMGLSGSGKSTLIRHINRLIEPSEGKIIIDNQDVLQMNNKQLTHLRRNKISMVFQRFALLPHKTVLENVAYGLIISGLSKKEAYHKSNEKIKDVGLQGYEDQYPSQLSGGMQQRVGLARALVTEAEILLMDEAFSALDPLIRSEMQNQLLQLKKIYERTILFITHDLDEAFKIGDRIAILKDGELIQVGLPEQILNNPKDDYVKAFVQDYLNKQQKN